MSKRPKYCKHLIFYEKGINYVSVFCLDRRLLQFATTHGSLTKNMAVSQWRTIQSTPPKEIVQGYNRCHTKGKHFMPNAACNAKPCLSVSSHKKTRVSHTEKPSTKIHPNFEKFKRKVINLSWKKRLTRTLNYK